MEYGGDKRAPDQMQFGFELRAAALKERLKSLLELEDGSASALLSGGEERCEKVGRKKSNGSADQS